MKKSTNLSPRLPKFLHFFMFYWLHIISLHSISSSYILNIVLCHLAALYLHWQGLLFVQWQKASTLVLCELFLHSGTFRCDHVVANGSRRTSAHIGAPHIPNTLEKLIGHSRLWEWGHRWILDPIKIFRTTNLIEGGAGMLPWARLAERIFSIKTAFWRYWDLANVLCTVLFAYTQLFYAPLPLDW